MSVSDVKKINQLTETRIAFIADDIRQFNEFDINHNATFGLMLAAQELNTKVLLTESSNLKVNNNKVFAQFDEVLLSRNISKYLIIKNSFECSLDTLEIIFARKDPPVNENFISYAQTLLLVSNSHNENKTKPFIINNPSGILKVNEKLYALNFPTLIPPTLVSYNIQQIKDFLFEYDEAVIKPIFNKGGEGVYYLNKKDMHASSIIEKSTLNGTRVALVQKYLKEVKNGDKRIVILNGEPLGAIYRIPKEGEFRANIRHGSTVKACELSKKDLEICKELKPYFMRDGIYFASIDVIGDYLIETNVTCPASLQEVERCTGRRVAKEIVSWALSLSSSNKSNYF